MLTPAFLVALATLVAAVKPGLCQLLALLIILVHHVVCYIMTRR